MRKFEKVSYYKNRDIIMPTRATKDSAGYDIYSSEDFQRVVQPGDTIRIETGLKAYMNKNEVLLLYVRSSVAINRGLVLATGTSVIDGDYTDNETNEGNIVIALRNVSNNPVVIGPNEKLCQGVFVKYLTTDDDVVEAERTGGIGSTNEN